MTRGLMCISSKMPGWMNKSTYNPGHTFQELGMIKKKKVIFADNVSFRIQ